MGARGPAPKDPSLLIRRNKPPRVTVLSADGHMYGPDLPESYDWAPQTRVWWDTWRMSAQAAIMVETDWCFLLDTAVLHTDFWRGDRSCASELRQRVSKFGATPDDRQRLRIAIADDGVGVQPVVSQDGDVRESQRARLLKSVGSA